YGREGAAHREGTEIVGLHLGACGGEILGRDQAGLKVDTGVVDEKRNVAALTCSRGDVGWLRDVERKRHHRALVTIREIGQAFRLTCAGIDLGCTARDQRLDKGAADTSVGAGDQRHTALDLHGWVPLYFDALSAHFFISPFEGRDSSNSFLAVSMPA